MIEMHRSGAWSGVDFTERKVPGGHAMTDPSPQLPAIRRKPDSRRAVAAEVLMLQLKLFIGGLHNLVLAPLTIAAAAFDLVFDTGGEFFYRVLGWGKEADEAIGLYAALDHHEKPVDRAPETVVNEAAP
jgi:hypothetical protein